MANLFVRSRPTTNWAANTAYALGDRRKATAAVLGKHFEATTAGTSHATTEPTWDTTVGNTTADGTVVWTCRGSAAVWVASTAYILGDRVVSTTAAAAAARNYVYECTTAGNSGNAEPAWVTTTPDTSTTTDNAGGGTAVWTLRKCSTWNNATINLNRLFGDTSGTGKTAIGDIVYVSHTHAETGANGVAIAFAFSAGIFSSATSPMRICCVNDVGDPSAPSTGATTASVTSATNGNISFSSGYSYIYGIQFISGSGASGNTLNVSNGVAALGIRFEACTLKLGGSGSGSFFFGVASSGFNTKVELENVILHFTGTSQVIDFSGGTEFSWHGGSIAGSAPTTLITTPANAFHHTVNIHGVDMSVATGNLVTVSTAGHMGSVYNFVNCKLGTTSLSTGTHAGIGGPEVNFINCDSADTNWNYYRETAQGTIVDELTHILTGGASDGTTPLSWKLVTNANSKFGWPLVSAPIVAWNDTTGAKTATVEIESAATLTDADVWVEVDYLANSADPGGLAISDRAASPVATAANQASSSASWAGGLGGAVTQNLSVAFTANKKGAVRARVMLAKASATVYVNPQLTIA